VPRNGELLAARTSGAPEPRTLDLPASHHSSLRARAYTQEALASWNLSDLSDDVLLIVGELVTNAILHAEPPITLVLNPSGHGVRVEVIDTSPVMPVTPSFNETRTSGRGLAIIAAISAQWGAQPLPSGGKSVWARVDRSSMTLP
jgi:hypothetical protein